LLDLISFRATPTTITLLELCWLLDRKLTSFLACKDSGDVFLH
jgi:hypothetical protein